MVFSHVPSAEQGADFVVKTQEFEDSQVESFWKMKKRMIENLNLGRELWGPKVKVIIQKPIGTQWDLFSRFVMNLNEVQNVMLLQESEKVNITGVVEQKWRIFMKITKSIIIIRYLELQATKAFYL